MENFKAGDIVWEAMLGARPVFCKCCGHQTHLQYRPRVKKYRVLKVDDISIELRLNPDDKSEFYSDTILGLNRAKNLRHSRADAWTVAVSEAKRRTKQSIALSKKTVKEAKSNYRASQKR